MNVQADDIIQWIIKADHERRMVTDKMALSVDYNKILDH